MRADIGDRVIIRGTRPGVHDRDGEVVALHHADGAPPWDVLWSDSGRTTLLFPGPDTLLHHFGQEDHVRRGDRATVPPTVRGDTPAR
jgi:hypothetical protein